MKKQIFGHIIEQRIIKIYRVDFSKNYEFYRPFGVFIMFNDNDGFLF